MFIAWIIAVVAAAFLIASAVLATIRAQQRQDVVRAAYHALGYELPQNVVDAVARVHGVFVTVHYNAGFADSYGHRRPAITEAVARTATTLRFWIAPDESPPEVAAPLFGGALGELVDALQPVRVDVDRESVSVRKEGTVMDVDALRTMIDLAARISQALPGVERRHREREDAGYRESARGTNDQETESREHDGAPPALRDDGTMAPLVLLGWAVFALVVPVLVTYMMNWR